MELAIIAVAIAGLTVSCIINYCDITETQTDITYIRSSILDSLNSLREKIELNKNDIDRLDENTTTHESLIEAFNYTQNLIENNKEAIKRADKCINNIKEELEVLKEYLKVDIVDVKEGEKK